MSLSADIKQNTSITSFLSVIKLDYFFVFCSDERNYNHHFNITNAHFSSCLDCLCLFLSFNNLYVSAANSSFCEPLFLFFVHVLV